MKKFLLIVFAPLCLAAPQVGFGDASQEEIAEIRGGTYLEGFDENPQYNFNYKVADDKEQTYIAKDETRDGAEVTGSYSYVDPLGSLITVTYTAGVGGYQETREVQENFITIREKPVKVGANRAVVSVNAVAAAEARRLEAARIEASRRQAQRAAAAEAARIETSRLQAQRAAATEAARIEAARIEASRRQAQRAAAAEAARIETSRLQALAARIEAARIESARLQAERALASEAARLEAEREASAQQTQADLVAQIVSQISGQLSGVVASTVAGSRGRNIQQVPVFQRVPVVQQVQQTSAASPVTDLFGAGGNLSVRLSTPDVDISYGH